MVVGALENMTDVNSGSKAQIKTATLDRPLGQNFGKCTLPQPSTTKLL